ncbi:MAG: RNA-guided endonuclease InsQ/TnpB family protein [Methanothrix sp.]
MKTAYKFRLYPNKHQEAQLALTLDTCRRLWNKALADRKNAWEREGITRSYEDQAALLVFEKQSNPYLNAVHSQVEQDVLRRLQKSFDNFFRRVSEGARKKGYPRFKSINRYSSVTYPQSGFKLNGSRLKLSKIFGTIRTFVHRPIVGRIKTCSIKRDKTNAWYVIFTTELENPTKQETKTTIGVDLGITHAAVTSDGQYFDYPKYYVQAEKKNRAANKSLHRKELGSNNRKKAQTKLARIAKRVTNLREEFLHQVSRKLVNSADRIIFEDLSIQNMLKNHCLAKHIQDVSWGKLIRFTIDKAERAGKTVVLVNPHNTSKRCSACGENVPKKLKDRVHICSRCGLIICRDLNASMGIRTLGLRGIACGEPTSGFGLRPE